MTNTEFSPLTSSPVTVTETSSSQTLALAIAAAADDRKAADIVILDVTEVSYLTDYFVIVTGFSRTQVRAISDSIAEKVAQVFQREPERMSGKNEASWLLMDYAEVIVHILQPAEREFYNLEAFWGHAKRVPFSA